MKHNFNVIGERHMIYLTYCLHNLIKKNSILMLKTLT
jgi:hypothetical protein